MTFLHLTLILVAAVGIVLVGYNTVTELWRRRQDRIADAAELARLRTELADTKDELSVARTDIACADEATRRVRAELATAQKANEALAETSRELAIRCQTYALPAIPETLDEANLFASLAEEMALPSVPWDGFKTGMYAVYVPSHELEVAA